MKRLLLLALSLAAAGPLHASVDFTSGSLYRTTGVPAWTPQSGTFTMIAWVYAPDAAGANDFIEADNGTSTYAGLGSAPDTPTEPYFLTKAGEFHFNKDGSFTANPPLSFDITQGWTYLAVSFTSGGATDLYAWQSGVNSDALVHIPAQTQFSTMGGSGTVDTLVMGNARNFSEGCTCFVGPVYVYDGVALTQAQIDAQRHQAAPLISDHLIVYSPFNGTAASFTTDGSGTANWTVHGGVSANSGNPPIQYPAASSSSSSSSGGSSSSSSSSSGSSSGGSSGGSSSGGSSGTGSSGGSGGDGGGGAMTPFGLLGLLGAGLLRRRSASSRQLRC